MEFTTLKITKKTLLKEVRNDMVSGFYHLINFRIYNEDKTRYRKGRYVLWTEYFDILEFYNLESFTKENLENYLNEISYLVVEPMVNNVDGLMKWCNQTINLYNNQLL